MPLSNKKMEYWQTEIKKLVDLEDMAEYLNSILEDILSDGTEFTKNKHMQVVETLQPFLEEMKINTHEMQLLFRNAEKLIVDEKVVDKESGVKVKQQTLKSKNVKENVFGCTEQQEDNMEKAMSKAERRKASNKKKGKESSDESKRTINKKGEIHAVSQLNRFHEATLETMNQDVYLTHVYISVGDKPLLTEAVIKIEPGCRYG